eukprot:TRINITY_DN7889_c0_g1_i1.p1 TRINITY_DN7889_c0_g1~~TRINITY_DN7889_c0_g1_i1.p1  ORF type:complete len:1222 (-),score=181.06 TRINITY_DN7889_c0_g1_i1:62-3727(-)
MSKFAEKSEVLRLTGEQILQRLSFVRAKFNQSGESPYHPRPPLVGDEKLKKVCDALVKKFPDYPSDIEKAAGYSDFTSSAKTLHEQFQPCYFTFVDAVEWCSHAQATLLETNNIASFSRTENYTVCNAFLDLLTLYARVRLLIQDIPERGLIFSAAAKLHQIVKLEKEPNYDKVAKYISLSGTSDTIKKMYEDLAPIAKKICSALISLTQSYMKVENLQILRKDGAVSITTFDEKLSLPTADLIQFDFIDRTRMSMAILYGFLLCPSELATPGSIGLLKMALSTSGWYLNVHGSSYFAVHNEYDHMFNHYKTKDKNLKLSKDRKMISEALNASMTTGIDHHVSMRTFCLQELRNLYWILKDYPGLLGPKLLPVLAGLNASQDEIFWYMRHFGNPIPKNAAKTLTLDKLRDDRIGELIYYSQQITKLIRVHYRIIQNYYIRFMKNVDAPKVGKVKDAARAAGTQMSGWLDLIQNDLDNLDVEGFTSNTSLQYDLQPLRLNWLRIESHLSSASTIVTVASVKELVSYSRIVMWHSRCVDSIEDMIQEYATLKNLFFFRRSVCLPEYSRNIQDAKTSRYSYAFIRMFQEFPEVAGRYHPLDRDAIGKESARIVEQMQKEVSIRVSKALVEIYVQYIKFHTQLDHVNAAYPMLQKLENYKFDKNFVPPQDPASESVHKERANLQGLKSLETNVRNLCAAANEFTKLVVFDTEMIPREFIAEGVQNALQEVFSASLFKQTEGEVAPKPTAGSRRGPSETGGPPAPPTSAKPGAVRVITRPSVLEDQIRVILSVVKQVDNGLEYDIPDLMRTIYLSNMQPVPASMPPMNKLEWSVDLELKWAPIQTEPNAPPKEPIAKLITSWYADFVTKTLSLPGIMYSPLRKSFITRGGKETSKEITLPIEEYADYIELQSLCRIVGPFGVKALDREILKFIVFNVGAIKQILIASKDVLKSVATGYNSEDVLEAQKNLKQGDAFLQRTITIGNAMAFRSLLREAQRSVTSVQIPLIYNEIDNGFSEYPINLSLKPEMVEMDALALNCGIETVPGVIDQSLLAVLSKAITDADLDTWKLLPIMFAASFVTKSWCDTSYRPFVEAYENSSQTMIPVFHSLLAAVKVGRDTDGKGSLDLQRQFVEIGSCILLRLQQANKRQAALKVKSFPSMLIFIDKFVEASPQMNRAAFEQILPYIFVRSMYTSLYLVKPTTTKGQKGKGAKKAGAATGEDGEMG